MWCSIPSPGRFVADGLAAGEQVGYFDDGTADCVLERLVDDRVDVDDSLRRGQVQVVPSEHTRAALLAPVEELAGLLQGYIEAACGSGWSGVRLTGQANYGLRRRGGLVFDEHERGPGEDGARAARARPLPLRRGALPGRPSSRKCGGSTSSRSLHHRSTTTPC
jgi:hypothetical protein